MHISYTYVSSLCAVKTSFFSGYCNPTCRCCRCYSICHPKRNTDFNENKAIPPPKSCSSDYPYGACRFLFKSMFHTCYDFV